MRNNFKISPKTFIKTWQKSESPRAVAQKLGLNLSSVHQRACSYRKHGIKLKKMERVSGGGKAYDWAALAKYAEGLAPEDEK